MENIAECYVAVENRRILKVWVPFCIPVRQCEHGNGLSKGTETKEVSPSRAFIQTAYWKCAFPTWSLFFAWALHSLAGELMNSRSRYTAESKAIVCIIRKCAPFPEGNSSKLNLNQKIPGQNCLGIVLSFSFLSPCSVNNPTKAWV